MKRYVVNVLIYLAALFGILAFIALFSSPLQIYNPVSMTWSVYSVKAYLGESINGVESYKGTGLPVVGFVVPIVLSIILIIESFQPSWDKKISIINTILSIAYFICAILVLLTKELFLTVNNYGDYIHLRNGGGPIFSAICSTLSGLLLLVTAWFPSEYKVRYIEK